MTAVRRVVTTSFHSDAVAASALFKQVLKQLGLQLPQTSVNDEARVELVSGDVIVTVAPANEVEDAAGGLFEMSATRLNDLSESDWKRVTTVISRLPFTATELGAIAEAMPLTSGLPSLVRGQPLAGISAIFTIHHMRDFVTMIRTAISLGLSPPNITVIDKLYRYEVSGRVDETLISLGIRVERYSDLTGAIRRHLDRARAIGQRTLVLDDGGYIYPILFSQFRDRLQEIIGIIEQTTSGIWKLRPYDTIALPVFNVAESELKATIEAYGVTDAVVRNLQRLAPDEMWEGRPALVIGLGKLGSGIAFHPS